MTKQEFLEGLQNALAGEVPSSVLNDNMRYYEEYIVTEMRKGKSEEEVMEMLGDPRLIARTIIDTTSGENAAYADSIDYDTRGFNEENAREEDRQEQYGPNIHFFGGWKAILALFIIFAVIIGVLALFVGVIGYILYFFGPVILIGLLVMFFLSRTGKL